MPERRIETRDLRILASATLAFQAWLDGGAASVGTDGEAQEAHRQLQAVSRLRPPSEPTFIYDSHGRVTGTIDPPSPPDYSLRLGDASELLVATRTDVFVFTLNAREVLHFVARRPLAPGAPEGDEPSYSIQHN